MLRLRLTTFLTPMFAAPLISAGWAGAALAATTVSSASTTPLATSTAGDTTVASGGSITVTGQPAITVDSANTVTIATGGALNSSAGNNGGGVLQNGGTTSTISNAGAISVGESFTAPMITGTSVAAGPIANTTGRYGILTGGSAAGSIINSGTVSIKGLGAIGIGTAGLYTGTITNTGSVSVIGDGARAFSLHDVSGDVVQGGAVSAVGSGAQDLLAAGNIGGALTIAGAMTQPTSFNADAGTAQSLSATAVNTGTPLVEIDGNVGNGVVIFAPCTPTTVSNVASCTSTSTTTTAGSIAAVGNNPALQIGGANPITIGAGAASMDGSTYSLAVDGSITASASFAATNATALSIGGRGGTVALPGGIGVAGTISATAVDSTATALQINPGTTVTNLVNTGTIKASLTQTGGNGAYAVRDLSGTLVNLTNHGTISATAALTSRAVDLSANTSGVVYTQSLTAYQQAQQTAEQSASTYNPATAVVYVSTVGNVVTGSGNDTVAIQSGTVTGNGWLGGGNDAVALSGDTRWVGDLHFGSGSAAITLANTAKFAGALFLADQSALLTVGGKASAAVAGITGGSQLAVVVNGGKFGAGSATPLALNSLTVNAGGALNAWIDGTGASSLIQVNTASFASGAVVSATVASLGSAAGTYHILSAGSLTGNPSFDASTTVLPVLFKGSAAVQGNDLYLTIARKTATDLGLNVPEAAAYDAIYANALANQQLATSLLQASNTAALTGQFDQMLPDYAGGVFDFVTRGARLATRHLADDSSLFSISEVGGWLEPLTFGGHQQASNTATRWDDTGYGISSGLERRTGLGYLGASFAWIGGKLHDSAWQSLTLNTYDFNAFWRTAKGPFYAFANIGADLLSARSSRTFTGSVNGAPLTYASSGHWKGLALTGNAGLSYKLALPAHFNLKPMAVLEYARLHEGAYSEIGAPQTALAVSARNSKSLTARTTLTAAWTASESDTDGRPLIIELEGGRRNQLSGNLGATTAAFTGGNAFTLTPDQLKGGWLGEARVLVGGSDFTWQLAAGAEQAESKPDYSLRASLSLAF